MATTFATIRTSLPQYFVKDASDEFDALGDKNQKYAPLCASLTGYALERAFSGSTGRMSTLKGKAKDSRKGYAAPTRAAVAQIEEIKPQSIKGMTLAEVSDFAESFFMGALTMYAPKERAPSEPKPTALALAKVRIAELETQLAECMAECALLKRSESVHTTI